MYAPREKLLGYIQALESTNEQLLKSLKQCLILLSNAHPEIADKEKWQAMMDDFNRIVKIGDGLKRPEVPMVGGN